MCVSKSGGAVIPESVAKIRLQVPAEYNEEKVREMFERGELGRVAFSAVRGWILNAIGFGHDLGCECFLSK